MKRQVFTSTRVVVLAVGCLAVTATAWQVARAWSPADDDIAAAAYSVNGEAGDSDEFEVVTAGSQPAGLLIVYPDHPATNALLGWVPGFVSSSEFNTSEDN